jgi:hypothetical protein
VDGARGMLNHSRTVPDNLQTATESTTRTRIILRRFVAISLAATLFGREDFPR